VEKLSRELDKAKEASMANSSHIVFLSGEIQRLEKDNQVLQRLLGTSEDPATKRLVEAEARERQLRTQLDQDSSRHSSLLRDLNDHLSFLRDR
jgi:predicted  nucleic acid-binding Zn-ribbon protein